MTSNSNDTLTSDNHYMGITRPIRMTLLIIIIIPSTVCSFVHLYHLISKRVLRTALNNHSIIAIISTIFISQLIDVPLYINYLRLGYVWPQTPAHCIIWWNTTGSTFYILISIIAEASLARHILIFHEKKLLSTRKKRLLFHYIPLVAAIMYPSIYLLILQIVIPWDDPFPYDYTKPWCSYQPRFDAISIFSQWTFYANFLAGTIIAVISDITLIVRVIWQRHIRLRQPIVWKKYRKMTIQLLSVSIFCSSFNSPMLVYGVLIYSGVLPETISNTLLDFFFIGYFGTLFMPIIMIFSLPKNIGGVNGGRNLFARRQRQQLAVPMNIPIQT